MDDLDPLQMQQVTLELAMLPEGSTLQQQLGPKIYEQFVAKTRALGVEPAMLDRFQPWFAAMTLVQLQLMKLGLAPEARRRASGCTTPRGRRRQEDSGPGNRARAAGHAGAACRRSSSASSCSTASKTPSAWRPEIDDLLAAWRSGDSKAMAKLLAEGFDEYPDLYRPLTIDAIAVAPQIEAAARRSRGLSGGGRHAAPGRQGQRDRPAGKAGATSQQLVLVD